MLIVVQIENVECSSFAAVLLTVRPWDERGVAFTGKAVAIAVSNSDGCCV